MRHTLYVVVTYTTWLAEYGYVLLALALRTTCTCEPIPRTSDTPDILARTRVTDRTTEHDILCAYMFVYLPLACRASLGLTVPITLLSFTPHTVPLTSEGVAQRGRPSKLPPVSYLPRLAPFLIVAPQPDATRPLSRVIVLKPFRTTSLLH